MLKKLILEYEPSIMEQRYDDIVRQMQLSNNVNHYTKGFSIAHYCDLGNVQFAYVRDFLASPVSELSLTRVAPLNEFVSLRTHPYNLLLAKVTNNLDKVSIESTLSEILEHLNLLGNQDLLFKDPNFSQEVEFIRPETKNMAMNVIEEYLIRQFKMKR